MRQPLVVIDNVVKRFGNHVAVKGINLEIREGEFLAVMGPSGCGKSTLLYLLGLLDRPDGGEISIQGQLMSNDDDLARTAARCQHIGFVFQFHFLMLEFSALENVMMPLRMPSSICALSSSYLLTVCLS